MDKSVFGTFPSGRRSSSSSGSSSSPLTSSSLPWSPRSLRRSPPLNTDVCPSCYGKGKIKKNVDMIAPIPHDDDRLNRGSGTKIIVAALVVSVLFCALMFFFLYPRRFELRLLRPNLSLNPLNGSVLIEDGKANFLVQPRYRIKNNNFYPIYLKKLDVAVTLSGYQVARSLNMTSLSIPLRGTADADTDVEIVIGDQLPVYVLFCQDPRPRVHQFFMQFQVTATCSELGSDFIDITQNFVRVFCNYNRNR